MRFINDEYAEFFMKRMERGEQEPPSVLLASTRLLYHMGNIFRDNAPAPAANGVQIDRKRLAQLRQKRVALGHKPDDHELEQQQGYPLEKALASVGTDGTVLGEELRRIGYAGTVEPGFLKPCAFVELHIEQGPIFDVEGISIGAVENLQGISWRRVTIEGEQNHAGTTPTAYRVDAGLAAAKVITFLRRRCELPDSRTVATTGCITFEPNAINVIPSRAVFTVDVRNPDAQQLCAEEQALADYLAELERTDRVKITAERLSRFDPVLFDEGIVRLIEGSAAARGLSCRRMTSGAGQDAQMLARICPTAMIFVPSVSGVSHNPLELTRDADLAAGANVFLDVVAQLAVKE